jgi:hypothetical protein
LRRYEEDDDQTGDAEPEDKEMSMSPERDIPIEVALEEPEAAPAPPNDAPQQVVNGVSTSTALPQMPIIMGGKSFLFRSQASPMIRTKTRASARREPEELADGMVLCWVPYRSA